jgi:hypothetical protein
MPTTKTQEEEEKDLESLRKLLDEVYTQGFDDGYDLGFDTGFDTATALEENK